MSTDLGHLLADLARRTGALERTTRSPHPHSAWPWASAAGVAGLAITTTAWATVAETAIERPDRDTISFRVRTVTPAGTTGELRLRDPVAGVQLGPALFLPAAATRTNRLEWLHPWPWGWEASAGPQRIELQARRDAGTGAVTVHTPTALLIRDRRFSDGLASATTPWSS